MLLPLLIFQFFFLFITFVFLILSLLVALTEGDDFWKEALERAKADTDRHEQRYEGNASAGRKIPNADTETDTQEKERLEQEDDSDSDVDSVEEYCVIGALTPPPCDTDNNHNDGESPISNKLSRKEGLQERNTPATPPHHVQPHKPPKNWFHKRRWSLCLSVIYICAITAGIKFLVSLDTTPPSTTTRTTLGDLDASISSMLKNNDGYRCGSPFPGPWAKRATVTIHTTTTPCTMRPTVTVTVTVTVTISATVTAKATEPVTHSIETPTPLTTTAGSRTKGSQEEEEGERRTGTMAAVHSGPGTLAGEKAESCLTKSVYGTSYVKDGWYYYSWWEMCDDDSGRS
ncbi:hypothetical protein CC80DRAFT_487072 [Byssothecium circinans]|uniref:Uncharacterized protein n=1 Tax=Byssothecium circinans TaxID=147558 RepID=A0A6A5UFR1_9PLEO|nr:hypothetical protein CC80DRAFT_487072 [Byssothecium circinans]